MDEVEVRVLFFAKAHELIGERWALTRLPAAQVDLPHLKAALALRYPALLKACAHTHTHFMYTFWLSVLGHFSNPIWQISTYRFFHAILINRKHV